MINSPIAHTLNSFTNDILQDTVPSIISGAAMGWLVGVGPALGVFQGLTTSLGKVFLIKPILYYVSTHKSINPDTKEILGIVLKILEIVSPIYLTLHKGLECIESAKPYLPKLITWLKSNGSTAKYTFFKGVMVKYAPTIIRMYVYCETIATIAYKVINSNFQYPDISFTFETSPSEKSNSSKKEFNLIEALEGAVKL